MKKNAILLITLLVLVAAFAATRLFRTPARETNLDLGALRIDTARIAAVTLRTPDTTAISLVRNDSAWVVRQGEQQADAARFTVENLLRQLTTLQPERIVTRREDNWSTYEVTDTAAIRMEVLDTRDKEIAAWYIGKEARGMTYIRKADEDAVYAVEGYQRNHFKKTFNDWRDKLFLLVDKPNVARINFTYPADSGFVLQKKGSAWEIGGESADSARVAAYLDQLRFKELDDFAGTKPAGAPTAVVEVHLHNGDPVVIRGWKQDDAWILNATVQPGAWFRDSTFADDLFSGKGHFTP